ncbi:hypothetical protein ABLE68_01865 [Nocardioides sp. CN2-186]|uniref:bestrophin-like domain n=1 Tax=Nocardioides tweenelious TaxID=3156607 RepID=UPI0032B5B22E
MILLLIALAAAVAIGLSLARAVRRRHPEGPVDGARREWINVEDLTGPVVTLVALLLAFMLVQANNSYQRAEEHAATEAGLVESEYNAAGLLDEPDQGTLQGDLVCYARAVADLGWPRMVEGEAHPVVNLWSAQIQQDLRVAVDTDADRVGLSNLVPLQSDLTTSRDERLAETKPAVPAAMTWLIELAALLVIVLLIGFTWHLRRLVRLSLVLTIGVLFLLLVVGINELDTPFSGAISISPDRMKAVSARIESGGVDVTGLCAADGSPVAGSSYSLGP